MIVASSRTAKARPMAISLESIIVPVAIESPNRITNRNSGRYDVMPPLDSKPSSFSPAPSWKTSLSIP